jgi:hypothetical protein
LTLQAGIFVPAYQNKLLTNKTFIMKTKNLTIVSFIFLIMAFSMQAKAIVRISSYTIKTAIGGNDDDSTQIVQMEKRVNEIQSMDIENMSSGQKQSLRVEVKQMIRQGKRYGGRHPYLIGNIASGGVLAVILMALYAVLR